VILYSITILKEFILKIQKNFRSLLVHFVVVQFSMSNRFPHSPLRDSFIIISSLSTFVNTFFEKNSLFFNLFFIGQTLPFFHFLPVV